MKKMDKVLVNYIKDAVAKGYTIPQVRDAIIAQGRTPTEVDEAIREVERPVSATKTKMGPARVLFAMVVGILLVLCIGAAVVYYFEFMI